jgi:hypothetical protein
MIIFSQILAVVLISIFFLLSALHFYWAVGGKWAFETALPSDESGTVAFKPGFWACAIVGFSVFVFGILVAWYVGWISISFLPSFLQNAVWLIALIFLFRALGDFRYVGFFKQLKTTASCLPADKFAELDTKVYSPLCLFMGLSALFIAILN